MMPRVIVCFDNICGLFAILNRLVDVLACELRLRSDIVMIVLARERVVLVDNLMLDLLVFEIEGPLAEFEVTIT